MLSLEAIKSYLLSILPFHLQEELLEELFYCSSSIEFSESGEKLFSPGDAPKGFYWILKGTASIHLSSQKEISLREGDFIGFDNFISSEGHRFPILTVEAGVQTIFIDRRCYNLFVKEPDLSLYILHQHLKQLIRLKNDLGHSLAS
jgi:CRP-like cAMP-binding protein